MHLPIDKVGKCVYYMHILIHSKQIGIHEFNKSAILKLFIYERMDRNYGKDLQECSRAYR